MFVSLSFFFSFSFQFSPDASRGITMLLIGVGFTVGECVTALESMALDVDIGENWRWLMALSALPAILSLAVSLFFLDESPRFLYAIGKKREASKMLKRMEVQNNQPWCCCCCSTEGAGRRNRQNGGSEDAEGGGDLVEESLVKRRDCMEEDEDDHENVEDLENRSCTKHASDLYNAASPKDTAMVWLIFIVCSFLIYGLIWVLPMTLKDGGGKEESKSVATKVLFGEFLNSCFCYRYHKICSLPILHIILFHGSFFSFLRKVHLPSYRRSLLQYFSLTSWEGEERSWHVSCWR
jgi:MFS family permease